MIPPGSMTAEPLAISNNPEFPHLRTFVAGLAAGGLRNVCLSPGARSTPLTVSFAREPRIKCWSHVDERSSAFFALGVAKASRTPTAVVCTSGTAAANFFPAVVEAAHAGVPLIVLTADRPPELRDCEAGQTIDQIKLYGDFPKWFAEVGMPESGTPYFRTLSRRALREAASAPAGVVHLNFPLREPLIAEGPDDLAVEPTDATAPGIVVSAAPHPADADISRLAALLRSTQCGLIACGPADLTGETATAIDSLAARTGYPVAADPTSQMRRHDYFDRVLDSYDSLVASESLSDDLAPDLVLRFGGLPICKPLRLWLERHEVPQIVIDPNGRWNDPCGTAREIWRTDIAATCNALLDSLGSDTARDGEWSRRWFAADRQARKAKDSSIAEQHHLSGVGLFARLARNMAAGSTLYVGNSLPIRQLEAIWPADATPIRVLCNRGANGIDGVVSSVLGAAAVSSGPVVAVLGDLSFYHDLNGLLAAHRYPINATIIVPNNDGGGIFSMLPQARPEAQLGAIFDEYFTTPHGLDFRHAAEMYTCGFDRVEDWSHFDQAFSRAQSSTSTNIIEIPIDTARDLETTRVLIAAGSNAASALDSRFPPARS